MYLILNNDKEHILPITELTHNYLEKSFIIKQHIISNWSLEDVKYLIALKETPITSILIENDEHEKLGEYVNIDYLIDEIKDFVQYYPGDRIIAQKELYLIKNES